MKYIGIDLGGTKVLGAIFSKDGEILFDKYILLDGKTGPEVGELLISLINDLCATGEIGNQEKMSIGVCIPGIAYSNTGCVWAPNIPGWENYPLKEEILNHFPNAIVTIESDRTCYILGETTMGCAKGCKNAVFIAVGTGIGAGILIDNHVLHGNSDIVGAVGWMALKPPYLKRYDQCGCFESHCPGEGIATQAKLLLKGNKSYSGELKKIKLKEITSYHIFEAYSHGDPIAKKVLDQAIEMWGMAAANLVSILNPEKVIFGGGLFGPASKFIGRIAKEAQKWAQPISIKQVEFLTTQLPKMAGLYGAGAVAIKFSNNQ